MGDIKVIIALGATVYSNSIKQKKITINTLFKNLSKPLIRKSKDGEYFVFASFKGQQRNAASVKFYYGATLDIDNSLIEPKEIKKILRQLKSRYCIHSTYNHKRKGNRYRIVIPYMEPISKDKHVETTIYLNSLFGMDEVDTSSKALSRPMYLPACPSNRKKHFYFYDSKLESLLDVNKKIEIPAHIKWALDELNHLEKVDIIEEITEGGRNDHITRVTGTLIQQGKTLQEIIDFCDEVNQLKFTPPMKSSELAMTVKSIWKSHTRNHGDKDWSYDQILDRVKKAKNVESDLDHIIEAISNSISIGKTTALQADKILIAIKKKDESFTIGSLRQELRHKQKLIGEETKKKSQTLDIDPDLDSPVIDKIRKEYSDYYFIASENMMYNRKYEKRYKLEGFNNANSNLKQDFGYSSLTPFRILDQIDAIKKVDAVKYHPGKESIYRDYNGMLCLNSYQPPSIKPYKGKIRRLKKHFEYLFPLEKERNIILDFIAFNYQNPGVKMQWCPIIKGRKGIGKSIIANKILTPIFGHSNVRNLNNTQPLLKEFNAWQADTRLVVIHELYISNKIEIKQQVTENIKSFITDDFLTVRKMHTDGFQQENMANMIGFTNHEDSLYITDDERRFCMIKCEAVPKPPKYYTLLTKYIEKNLEAIAYYFNTRKIETISPHVLPSTVYTRELINSSKNWAEVVVHDELKDPKSPFREFKAMCWTGICHTILRGVHKEGVSVNRYEDIFNGSTSSGRLVRQALIESGFRLHHFESGQDRVRINGQLDKIWITPIGIKEEFYDRNKNVIIRESEKCSSEAQFEFRE